MVQARLRNRKQSPLRIGSVRRMNSPNAACGLLVGGSGPATTDNCGTTRRSLARICCPRRWRMVRQYVAGDIMLDFGPRKSTAHSRSYVNLQTMQPVHRRNNKHACWCGVLKNVLSNRATRPRYVPMLSALVAFPGLFTLRVRNSREIQRQKSTDGPNVADSRE